MGIIFIEDIDNVTHDGGTTFDGQNYIVNL
jgi:hypothetical protein